MAIKSNCDCCINYFYDEEYDCFECEVNLDEDEMVKFMKSTFDDCPYFRLYDEYKTVRKQIWKPKAPFVFLRLCMLLSVDIV